MLDFKPFEILTFDCYGTLIDWERGILAALRPLLARRGIQTNEGTILQRYGELEEAAEKPPYRSYRAVLQHVVRGFGAHLNFEPTSSELSALADALPRWQPFPDTINALNRLHSRYQLGVISNIDDDLFAATNQTLGINFDHVITAQSVGSYKPDPKNFTIALERIGKPKERVLHVAQSLFHDIAPANALGITTVWVNRHGAVHGFGAVRPAQAHPDLTVPDLKTLADLAGV